MFADMGITVLESDWDGLTLGNRTILSKSIAGAARASYDIEPKDGIQAKSGPKGHSKKVSAFTQDTVSEGIGTIFGGMVDTSGVGQSWKNSGDYRKRWVYINLGWK